MPTARIIHGDCTRLMPKVKAGSIDCIISDPPYPCIRRDYGTLTEADWHAMMDTVVAESRRVLKPTGSAVFILQPNAKRAGEMRLWLWEFVVKWGKAWGLVQDVYWWNYAALPTGGTTQQGLCRGSLKFCVWLGPHDCYRNQNAVLWSESETSERKRLAHESGRRASLFTSPSTRRRDGDGDRLDMNRTYAAAKRRGGVTPFNVIPASNTSTQLQPEATLHLGSHPSRTPAAITEWWIRYLCPPGGTVLDPFAGSGTTLFSALELGQNALGIEQDAGYVAGVKAHLSSLT